MAGFLQILVGLTAAILTVSGAVIGHDKVVGFPETTPSGSLYLKYKPFLKVFNGCVPFPAVNPAGDTRLVTKSLPLITNTNDRFLSKVEDYLPRDLRMENAARILVRSMLEVRPTTDGLPSCILGTCPRMSPPPGLAIDMIGKTLSFGYPARVTQLPLSVPQPQHMATMTSPPQLHLLATASS